MGSYNPVGKVVRSGLLCTFEDVRHSAQLATWASASHEDGVKDEKTKCQYFVGISCCFNQVVLSNVFGWITPFWIRQGISKTHNDDLNETGVVQCHHDSLICMTQNNCIA